MTTLVLVVVAAVLLAVLAATCCQMVRSPVWMVFHVVCGTVGGLCEVLGAVLVALLDAARGD